jgi:predicted Kef-type K+ transport protein
VDLALLLVAFGFGFAASAARLPPLVGYLVAGFVLHAFGYQSTDTIEVLADLGVLLLLFGIGLKLELRTLQRPVVWAGAGIHMAATTAAIGTLFLVIGALGLPLAAGLTPARAALVGFAFSFSSTVFAVKALEERNESASLQGQIAVGILVVQDIFAVVFLTLAVDTPPSIWAIPVVIAVVAAKPIYGWLLDRSGHGELLLLLGLALAVGLGAETFEQVGLKADLGALVVGLTLAAHQRAPELAETLLGFKDILLIGFFLSIGLGGAPEVSAVVAALVVLVVLPIKTAGFVFLMSRFRLRARTAWHSSISLATYSEFGLIVAVIGVERDLIDRQWASAIVKRRGEVVLGVDRHDATVASNRREGRVMVRGDALDVEFWGRLRLDAGLELVVLAMSDHAANLEAVRRVKEFLPDARIAAASSYADDVAELREAGVDVARNLYGEAGQGLADDACDLLDIDPPRATS